MKPILFVSVIAALAQAPIAVVPVDPPPAPTVYVNTMNPLMRPSGQIYVTNEVIGPLYPVAAASFTVRMTFEQKIPGTVVLCRETSMGAVCRTLDEAIPVGRR